MLPLLNVGMPDFGLYVPELAFECVFAENSERHRKSVYRLETPVGTLEKAYVEHIRSGTVPVKFAVESEDDLRVLDWYLDGALQADLGRMEDYLAHLSGSVVGQRAALSL